MEPAGAAGTRSVPGRDIQDNFVPQWSPPLTSENTHAYTGRQPELSAAAMEPAGKNGGSAPTGQRGILAIWLPQWSPPPTGGRTTQH